MAALPEMPYLAPRALGATGEDMYRHSPRDEQMIKFHKMDGKTRRAQAETIAKALLSTADLPLVFRARACMVLGCSHERDFLHWAKEAVRTVQRGIGKMGGTSGNAELELLQQCQETCKKAEEDFDCEEAASVDTGEDMWEEKDIRGAPGQATVIRTGPGGGWEDELRGVAKPTDNRRVRLMRSGRGEREWRFEEFDRAVDGFVPLGTAVDPQFVDPSDLV